MNRIACLLLLSVACLPLTGRTQTVPSPSADTRYEAFTQARQQQQQAGNVRPPADETPEQRKVREDASQAATEAAVARAGEFLAAFPDDARRWDVLAHLARSTQRRFTGPTAGIDAMAWQAFQQKARQDILDAPDASSQAWEAAIVAQLFDYMRAGRGSGAKLDLAGYRVSLDRLAQRDIQSRWLRQFELDYTDRILEQDPAQGEELLRKLTASPNEEIARFAAGRLNALQLKTTPVEMRFTAADGKTVDLAKLRGKVVVVDYWATWCVPCMMEMPNTRAAYNAYKKHGVELIGISFDSAPRDPANPGKSSRTREQLLKQVKELGMTWPQYYDGKGWDNEIGRKYAIDSIPRVWLLDKQGRLVTQHANGRKIWELLAEHTGYRAKIPADLKFEDDEG